MGCWQCLPLIVVQLKGKHCRKPHCRNGVVGTFELYVNTLCSLNRYEHLDQTLIEVIYEMKNVWMNLQISHEMKYYVTSSIFPIVFLISIWRILHPSAFLKDFESSDFLKKNLSDSLIHITYWEKQMIVEFFQKVTYHDIPSKNSDRKSRLGPFSVTKYF